MTVTQLLLVVVLSLPACHRLCKAQDTPRGLSHRLSKPLIGDDGRIYTCQNKNFFAFESNGSIAWTIHLDYKCNNGMAPVHGGHGKDEYWSNCDEHEKELCNVLNWVASLVNLNAGVAAIIMLVVAAAFLIFFQVYTKLFSDFFLNLKCNIADNAATTLFRCGRCGAALRLFKVKINHLPVAGSCSCGYCRKRNIVVTSGNAICNLKHVNEIYLVAESRILRINFESIRTSEPEVVVFFGPAEPGQQAEVEIVGVSVSTLSSTVFINIKNRGLFAYLPHGDLLWSVGPLLYQFGYHQGCRKNLTDCYFASVPVLDQCEASIYISNTEGELYCLSIRSRHFRWIQDFSSLDKIFTITPANNGHLYVTVPMRALVLALDAFSGNILWQRSIGPLSRADCAPVVDSNGWVSIGSLDGFLYSFSPNGILKKFSRRNTEDSVVQVGPFLDCSGFAVYYSQIEMEGKVSQTIDEYTHVSAIRPKAALFTMLVPATGSIYWSESYPGQFSTSLSKSDLSQFVVDEEILLAFLVASKSGNPLQCRTAVDNSGLVSKDPFEGQNSCSNTVRLTCRIINYSQIRNYPPGFILFTTFGVRTTSGQKLASSCSQARTELVSVYTGNERARVLFLLFESAVLALLAGLVRFCCTFWTKRQLKDQGLGSFLDERRSLQLRKKAFDRTITELEQKAAEEAVDNEVFEKLGDILRERECIERKLSTTYSLGRDRTDSRSKSLLPVSKGKIKSYSFKGAKKESVTIFQTLSDTSSSESSTEGDMSMLEEGMDSSAKAKAKAPMMEETSSDDEFCWRGCRRSPLEATTSPKLFIASPEAQEASEVKSLEEGEEESMQKRFSSTWLKRRKTLSSTN